MYRFRITDDAPATLASLRAATRDRHHALERHPLFRPLLGTGLERRSYAVVLAALHGFYRALEPRLRDFPLQLEDAASGYRYLPRVALLRRDLADLGASHLPDAAHRALAPEPATPGHMLGILYVLEGATEGGCVIAPKVVRSLPLAPDRGARYFHLHVHGSWPAFRVFAAHRLAGHDAASVVAGARETFRVLGIHLDAWQAHAAEVVLDPYA